MLSAQSKRKVSQDRGSSAQCSYKTPTQIKVDNVIQDFNNDFDILNSASN